jgi:hypothetical protein
MQTKVFSRIMLLLVAVADAACALVLRQAAQVTVAHVRHLDAWFAAVGTDRALAELAVAALWLAAVWLALGLVAALATRLPGFAGRWSALACRALLPAAARRLVAGSAGLGVLLAPVGALAATACPPAAAASAVSAPADRHGPGEPLPAPVWPSGHAPHRQAADPPDGPANERVNDSPNGAVKRSGNDTLRVRPGDCLWLLAARRLGPDASPAEVAAAWPRWYARNRTVIGADPNLLTPGELLHPPGPGTAPKAVRFAKGARS